MNDLNNILQNKILCWMAHGTMIQSYNLNEKDYRGEEFSNHTMDLKGNNDILSLVRPDIINDIHMAYLNSGADLIETNTFNSTSISQEDYGTQNRVYDITLASAKIAKKLVKGLQKKHQTNLDLYVEQSVLQIEPLQ